MDAEDLALVLETNLVTTRKRYAVGRHRMQVHFLLQLGLCTASRPKALLNLCYRHIMITLIRDPEGGPHKIVPEFTFEFTKEYLGMKEAYVPFLPHSFPYAYGEPVILSQFLRLSSTLRLFLALTSFS
jgi:hypothetical protein